jgi:branched-chain amino acid aminotransferase
VKEERDVRQAQPRSRSARQSLEHLPRLVAKVPDRAGEGIVLAVDGSLACGTMANLFVVRGDTLLTPSLASGCRAGVTREVVLEIAARVGLTAREEALDQSALFDADEAFFTSSRVECLPIAAVDGRAVGGSDHPHTAALRSALRAVVTDETTLATLSERRGIA